MNFEGISIEHLGHDVFRIKSDKIIYIDPFKLKDGVDKADIIFITHEHADHCSPQDIQKIATLKTVIVTVPDTQSKLSYIDFKDMILVEPGKEFDILGIHVKTVPAYNIDKWRSPGILYHPKENEMVGYILNINGTKIYHAGDTDKIPEMESLGEIDIALLPVSGTYVMTAMEAAETCKVINPKLAIPMHYGAIVGSISDAEEFKEKASEFCKVEII